MTLVFPSRIRIGRLTERSVLRYVEERCGMDEEAVLDPWRRRRFLLELPEKWELSLIVRDGEGRAAGFLVVSRRPWGVHVHRLVIGPLPVGGTAEAPTAGCAVRS